MNHQMNKGDTGMKVFASRAARMALVFALLSVTGQPNEGTSEALSDQPTSPADIIPSFVGLSPESYGERWPPYIDIETSIARAGFANTEHSQKREFVRPLPSLIPNDDGHGEKPVESHQTDRATGEEMERNEEDPSTTEEVLARKRIALTFDDGPHAIFTEIILDALRERGAKATFFVLGDRIHANPSVIQRIAAEGHEIGNHSWNHADLTRLNTHEIANQIELTQQAVHAWTGLMPRVVRPPYGAIDDNVRASVPLPLVSWSVDPRDWENDEPDQVIEHVLSKAREGDIVLLHDMYETTARLVGKLVDGLLADGYELVTVSELLDFKTFDIAAAHKGHEFRSAR